MLTRCPECATTFRVTPEQLKARQGRVRCGECQAVFNALDTLVDESPAIVTAPLAVAPPHEPEAAFAAEPEPEQALEPEVPPQEGLISEPEPQSQPEPEPQPESEPQFEPESQFEPEPQREREPYLEPQADSQPESQFAADPVPEPMRDEPEPEAASEFVPAAAIETEAELDAAPAPEPESVAPFEPPPEIRLEPTFDPEPEPSFETPLPAAARSFAWAWGLGAFGLILLLAAQAALHFRTEITVLHSGAKPALATACAALGCELRLPRKAQLVGIESSDLHPEADGSLMLAATLKNRAPFAQEYPHLELTLTDTADRPLVRRALAPPDYLPPETPPAAGFAADAELAVNLVVTAPDVPAVGYRLYLFYP